MIMEKEIPEIILRSMEGDHLTDIHRGSTNLHTGGDNPPHQENPRITLQRAIGIGISSMTGEQDIENTPVVDRDREVIPKDIIGVVVLHKDNLGFEIDLQAMILVNAIISHHPAPLQVPQSGEAEALHKIGNQKMTFSNLSILRMRVERKTE